jgi:HEAT repeat protein
LIVLLQALATAVVRGADTTSLVDDIEAQLEHDPEGSRTAVRAYTGDEGMRLWALGQIGDPRDFDTLARGLDDPLLRYTALEGLANQPDVARVDAIARSVLGDPDPKIRSKAARMVAFHARPGALASLLPLAEDPDPRVRMIVGWELGGLGSPAAESALLVLLTDSDEQVRSFAARGLARPIRRHVAEDGHTPHSS